LKIFKKLNGYFLYFKSIYLQYIEIKYRHIQRKRLKNKDFTIISNNCWGGRIYEDMGLPYKSPTIGLFFFAPCYINFVKDIRSAISLKLEFVDISRYEKAQSLRSKQWYPVGKLGDDIEIHFLHYESEAAAADKWNRRKERINLDNLFISFSDSEGYDLNELQQFDSIPYPKVFFSAQKIKGISSLIWLKKFRNQKHIGDIYTFPWSYRWQFDVVKWLNNQSKTKELH
jgi:uncharacterized protein (DUF1919 family)